MMNQALAHPIFQEHPDVVWEEVTNTSKSERAQPMTALDFMATSHSLSDMDPSPAHICRCWRCRSNSLFIGDMAQMDRILARHVLRMPEGDQTAWLREWEANPNHGVRGRHALSAWMAIEQGERRPEPVYFARVFE